MWIEKINQIIIFTFNMLQMKRIRYLEFNIKLFDFEPQLNFLKIYIKVTKNTDCR